MNVRDIIKSIQDLNPGDKHRLRAYLIDALTASSSTGNMLQEISERKNKEGYHCPNCESEHIVRNGKYTTLVDGEEVEKQRYLCKACKKTFTDLTNTTLYRTCRLNKWVKFVECMIDGYSLRKSAELMNVINSDDDSDDISYVTLFYWRHKLLSSLNKMEISDFQGIVEWTRLTFSTLKKGQEILKTENLGNEVELPKNVE